MSLFELRAQFVCFFNSVALKFFFFFHLFFFNILTVFLIDVQYTQYPRQVQVLGLCCVSSCSFPWTPEKVRGPQPAWAFCTPGTSPSQASSACMEELASRWTLAPGPLPHLRTLHTRLPVPCTGLMPSSCPDPQSLHPCPCPAQSPLQRPPTCVRGAGSIPY